MSIRKQTLEEWFTDYQLMSLIRGHHYVPIDVEVDVTRIVAMYAAVGQRAPFTAIAIKAAGLLAARHPEVNRAVLRTPLGTRVVQFEEAHVNLPVSMTYQGRRHLSAVVVRNADKVSIDEIRQRMTDAQERSIEQLPILRRLATKKNTLPQRVALAARHFVAYSVPHLYEKFGGGISVSSIVRPAPAGVTVRLPSYGPTAFTLCPGYVRTDGGRSTLFVGIGYDHTALSGNAAVRCADALGIILAEGDSAHFGPSAGSAFSTSTSHASVAASGAA